MKDMNKFWLILEERNGTIGLKEACLKGGLEWSDAYGGSCPELERFIRQMLKYQTKHFIKRILKNKKFQEKFVASDDFYRLYLLKTKARHQAIGMLFGEDSSFKLLNWEEMYAMRKAVNKT